MLFSVFFSLFSSSGGRGHAVEQGQIDFKPAGIDLDKAHLYALSESVGDIADYAAQFLPLGIVFKEILSQSLHADHAFQRHPFQFNKQAEMRHSADDSSECFTDSVPEQETTEATGNFPFRILCGALPFVAAIGNSQQLVPCGDGAARIKTERVFKRSVGDQIGITADGRGEMTVTG